MSKVVAIEHVTLDGVMQAPARRKLIDEFVLQIHPLVLGKGRRLFSDGSSFTNFSLVDSVTMATGVIIATYVLNVLWSA
jgi:dihydrofolate reductase